MGKITLVVPYHNEEANLEECIHSILGQTEMPNEVIFIDNNSTDNSSEVVSRYTSQFNVSVRILEEGKKGIPFARNRGIRESGSDYVAFLDADCVAPTDYISSLLAGFGMGVQAVTGRYVLVGEDMALAKHRQAVWEHHFGWDKESRMIDHLNDQDGTLVSGCSAFDRKALLSIGGFDTKFLYMDDVAVSERFYRNGYRAFMDPHISVLHKIDTSESSIFLKDLHYGYDHALINLNIGAKRVRLYPNHFAILGKSIGKSLVKGDPQAFYQFRTLVYHKIGLFMRGLTIGGMYI